MKKTTEDDIRPHVFDGIQEYDKRMPNWWLVTLWGGIAYAVAYWAYFHTAGMGEDPAVALAAEMKANAERASQISGVVDDERIWKMSRDSSVVAAGKASFDATCVSCHRPDLKGMIGPNLVDKEWIHGGTPLEVVKAINEGVIAKGMPPWGPVLGKDKIHEVTAYIFSFHQPGEEVIKVPGWTPLPPPAQ